MRLYLNGTQVGSTPKTGTVATNPTTPAWIGSNPGNPNQTYDGHIDELRIYTIALTPTELDTIAQTPITP